SARSIACCVPRHNHPSQRFDNYRSVNALAESIIGLFKTEVVRRHGPFKTISEVEYALMEWCDWYNNSRLHSRLGYLAPAEYEADYYAQLSPRRPALV
ncbi:integrase core domain-containing protein, partial [Nocardia asiatica]